MRVLDTAFAKGFIRVCDDGFNQNWHERNGGNLSYRIKKYLTFIVVFSILS